MHKSIAEWKIPLSLTDRMNLCSHLVIWKVPYKILEFELWKYHIMFVPRLLDLLHFSLSLLDYFASSPFYTCSVHVKNSSDWRKLIAVFILQIKHNSLVVFYLAEFIIPVLFLWKQDRNVSWSNKSANPRQHLRIYEL